VIRRAVGPGGSFRFGMLLLLAFAAGCGSLGQQAALSAGSKFYNAGQYEQAAAEYEKVVAASPDHWEGNYMIAASHMQLYRAGSTQPKDIEHAEKALAALDRCLKLPAPDAASHQKVEDFYAGLLTAMERTDTAITYFEAKLAAEPQSTDLLGRIGELYHRKGDFAHALEYFQRNAQANAQNKQAWYVVGVLCWEHSHKAGVTIPPQQRNEIVGQGLEAMNHAIEIDPKYRQALVYLNLLWRERAAALVDLRETVAAGEALNQAAEFERRAAAIPKEPSAERASG
jgi:tetratricopeptide (TPR) repeat protein